mmetsp:Transcript_19174/g.39125  ORF Transcript_19174/g.39125 Transcript_19174/m.39125 type:complete len:80 (+) Transcript_19174:431-670(+)
MMALCDKLPIELPEKTGIQIMILGLQRLFGVFEDLAVTSDGQVTHTKFTEQFFFRCRLPEAAGNPRRLQRTTTGFSDGV